MTYVYRKGRELGYTTRQAADAAGISLVTLQRWIAQGKVKAPRIRVVKGRAVRLWTKSDLSRLLAVKKQTYRKGRGRRKRRNAALSQPHEETYGRD